MSPEEEIEACLYELRVIAALMSIAEAMTKESPEDFVAELGLDE